MFLSIIIPTYNRVGLLINTLESVFEQQDNDYEVLIIDDGSTDDTPTIIPNWIQQKKSLQIQYFRKENAERGAARNFGIARARGDYVTFLDSDDILYPNFVAEAKKALLKLRNPVVFHLGYVIKEAQSNKILVTLAKNTTWNESLLDGNGLSCMGVVVRRTVLKDIQFEEDRKLSGTEDWLLWLRISARYDIPGVATITSALLNHESRSVIQADENQLFNRYELLIKYLKQDETFMRKLGSYLPRIQAGMLGYVALFLMLAGKKQKSLQTLWQAALIYPAELFQRRTLAIFKHLLK